MVLSLSADDDATTLISIQGRRFGGSGPAGTGLSPLISENYIIL